MSRKNLGGGGEMRRKTEWWRQGWQMRERWRMRMRSLSRRKSKGRPEQRRRRLQKHRRTNIMKGVEEKRAITGIRSGPRGRWAFSWFVTCKQVYNYIRNERNVSWYVWSDTFRKPEFRNVVVVSLQPSVSTQIADKEHCAAGFYCSSIAEDNRLELYPIKNLI